MKVLFIVAHPDDEAYGPYGTLISLGRQGHDIHVYCLCNGERPGAEGVAAARVDRFRQNCEIAGAKWKIWGNPDLSLDVTETAKLLSNLIATEQPDVVYTHNISDINKDHRTVAEATLIACRPKPDCSVRELYFYEVPSSTDWSFYKVQPVFQPNTYIEIADDIMSIKQVALGAYDTETYQFPDARSVEAMTTLAKHRGYQVGYNYAEAFQLVFSRVRKS